MPALTHAIKTEFTLYSGKEENGALPATPDMYPMRKADCTLVGETEKLQSDVKLPESRVQGSPEVGGQSSSGDVSTEWNIDEQDDWIAAVLCNDWEDGGSGEKTLTLGDKRTTFSMLKKYKQAPVEYQLYTGVQINQLKIDFETNSFVKLVFSLMGADDPLKKASDPITGAVYKDPMTTKAFTTRKGFLKIGDTEGTVVANRQCSNLSITINNNMENTPALFEEKSIEQSLGDFVLSGWFDVYNSNNMQFYNDAVSGADKFVQVEVERTVGAQTTKYRIDMKVHLDGVSEAKDGNKLKYTVNFTMNTADGIKITKTAA